MSQFSKSLLDFLLQKNGEIYTLLFPTLPTPLPRHRLFLLSGPWHSLALVPSQFQRVLRAWGMETEAELATRPWPGCPLWARSSSSLGWLGLIREILSTAALGRFSFSLPVYRYLVATVRLVWKCWGCSHEQDRVLSSEGFYSGGEKAGWIKYFPRVTVPGRSVTRQD